MGTPSSSARAERLYVRDAQGERCVEINAPLFAVNSPKGDGLFTLFRKNGQLEVLPGDLRLSLNGKAIKRSEPLHALDRLEWGEGCAVLLPATLQGNVSAPQGAALRSLEILRHVTDTLLDGRGLGASMDLLIDHILESSGAEQGVLLSEAGEQNVWRRLSVRPALPAAESPTRTQLFSQTVLREALERKEPVLVESLIGHPWAAQESLMAAKVYSVACLPLLAEGRPLGALFLYTRTPGRQLKREILTELQLLATQATLLLSVERELERSRRELMRVKRGSSPRKATLDFLPHSPLKEVERRIQKFAPTPLSVLVLGETGSGKELVARALHDLSERVERPFVALNCAAIPPSLIESTLFGHVKGAFTGATRSQPGKFQLAHGGTLFLDEIGELALDLQAKLLRVLQEGSVEAVGATRPENVDVRVIAATHRSLENEVRAGRFRQDLFFRLNGASVQLPALRERLMDLPLLCQRILQRIPGGDACEISDEALQKLAAHSWPGNVRELQQVLTRAVLLAEGSRLGENDIELGSLHAPENWRDFDGASLREAQRGFTRRFVQQVLSRHQGHRGEAALELGISERSLYRMLSDEALP